MEDFRVDFVVDKGAFAKTIKIPLKHFCLAGATTRAGLLTAPLRERFGIFHHLDFYSPEELQLIVQRSARILGTSVEKDASLEIARRSRGTPRIANRLLKRVRDYALVKAGGLVTREVADAALKMEGIDESGLDRLDMQFLRVIVDIYGGGPVGIETLAATLNEESDTLDDMIEPYLLKIGLISRTPSGRRATERCYEHLGLPMPGNRPDTPQSGNSIKPDTTGLFD
jgi:Holliday junction DNA helicase RuvB